MKSGDAYVDINTPTHKEGELRGQIESGGGNASSSSNTIASANATNLGNSTNTG